MFIDEHDAAEDEHPGHPGRPQGSSCPHCIARRGGVCGAMRTDAAQAALAAASPPLRLLERGALICHQGDPSNTIYCLTSGWLAQRAVRPDGRHGVTRFVLPGDIFGLEPDGATMAHSTMAITPSTICAMSKARHDQVRRKFPELNERFILQLKRDLQLMLDAASRGFEGSATTRLTYLLWSLAVRKLGRPLLKGGETISLPLTQLLIAGATGLTPVHVSRTLSRLRDEGLLDFGNERMVIRDTGALEAMAGADDNLAIRAAG